MNDIIEQRTRKLIQASEIAERRANELRDEARMLLADMEKFQQYLNRKNTVWMNKTQAGEYLGVTSRTILRYESAGKLVFNHSGRIHRSELDDYMREYKVNRARQFGLLNGRKK